MSPAGQLKFYKERVSLAAGILSIMTLDEKRELFLHWLVYQSAIHLFKEKLTLKETKHLYYILRQYKMSYIQKKTGMPIKSIKAMRTFVYKKIKPELLDDCRMGKDNIFFNLIFLVMPLSIKEDFFDEWKREFRLKSGEKFEIKDFDTKLINDLPIGIKKFDTQ